MRKVLLLIVSLFSLVMNAQKKQGQALIDSLLVELPKIKEDTSRVNLLNDLVYEYNNINPKKGLELGYKALLLSQKKNYKRGVATSWLNIGINYSSLSKNDKALLNFKNALQLFKEINDNLDLARVYQNIGNLYSDEGKHAEAFKNMFISLKISEKINYRKGIGANLHNIAATYMDRQDYQKAIPLLEKAIKINIEDNNKTYLSLNYHGIGDAYAYKKDYEKSIYYHLKGEKIAKEIGDSKGLSANLSSLAFNYYLIKDYKKSITYCFKALEIQKEMENQAGIGSTYYYLSGCYLELAKIGNRKANLNLAKVYCLKSNEISKKNKSFLDILRAYKNLSEIYALEEDYKSAYENYKICSIYNDSIYNTDNKETIKNLEDKRKLEVKEKELQINKLSLKAKEQQKWYYISGILFLGILGGSLLYQSMNRKKTNEKLQLLNTELDQANKIKARFFGILNHDLRGPVSNLIDFLHIQKDSPDLLDEETKKRIESNTIIGTENLLSSMEDILMWSKGQMENFKPQPKNILVNQLFADNKKVFSGYNKIKFEYQNPANIAIFTDENYLKTIVRNLTSNAINVFSSIANPTIIWKAWQENGISYLSITDNGPGGTEEQFKALYDDKEVVGIKSGLGLHLIRDLAKAINCEISVDTKKSIGTTFILKIK